MVRQLKRNTAGYARENSITVRGMWRWLIHGTSLASVWEGGKTENQLHVTDLGKN
jgi:hypothetical protein